MEGVMEKWEEVETEVEGVGLLKRQAGMHINNTTTSTANKDLKAVEHTNGFSGLNHGGLEKLDVSTGNFNIQADTASSLKHGDIEKNILLPTSDPPISEDSTSLYNAATEGERVGIITENAQEVQELHLERVYQKPPTQEFYCPNCNACIEKVLILNRVREETNGPAQPPPLDTFRCSSCFSFLIPIGSWLFPRLAPNEDEASTYEEGQHSLDYSREEPHDRRTKAAPINKVPVPDPSLGGTQPVATKSSKLAFNTAADSGNQSLQLEQVINDGANRASSEAEDRTRDSSNHTSEIPHDECGQDGSRNKPSVADWAATASASASTTLKEREIDFSENSKQQPQLEQVIVDGGYTALPASTSVVATTQTVAVRVPGSSRTWEILKSIVYGGLTESIASLSVVTSAASADATALNIVALSFANLIGGVFILGHNLWEVKSEPPRAANNQTQAPVDRYYQLLGQRENFFLHVSVAILSFLIFGLVPPVVYGFTFYESNDMDFKLAAVAGASLICITLLSLAKAYIERPIKYLTYFKTVLYYVIAGAMASIVSYLAGELIKKLLEKLGWFDSSSSFTLLLPEMSIEKPRFGSYLQG